MNRGRIIVLLMAVACAGLAMMLMRSMVNTPQTKIVKQEVSEIQVLVAKSEIPLGGRISSSQLKWQPWPGSAAKGYITKRTQPGAVKDFVGSIARVAIGSGDPIRATKLVKADRGGVMAAILPAGVRAISIKVNTAQGVSGLILPNDRVDVILYSKGKKKKDTSGLGSETLLRNIRVLAVGDTYETKERQKAIKAKTITLALTPSQVEIVTQNRDQIWLSLRALADASGDSGAEKMAANTKVQNETRRHVVKILRSGNATQRVFTNSSTAAHAPKPATQTNTIRSNCETKWGSDFRMIDNCIKEQVAAKDRINRNY